MYTLHTPNGAWQCDSYLIEDEAITSTIKGVKITLSYTSFVLSAMKYTKSVFILPSWTPFFIRQDS
jgi:hypothetical protein